MIPSQGHVLVPKRTSWRPRFSLRTLMIGVLLIAGSWAATAVWGVSTVRKNSFVDEFIAVDEQNTKIVSCHAILPFVVKIEYHTRDPEWLDTQTWFWLFGYTYCYQTSFDASRSLSRALGGGIRTVPMP